MTTFYELKFQFNPIGMPMIDVMGMKDLRVKVLVDTEKQMDYIVGMDSNSEVLADSTVYFCYCMDYNLSERVIDLLYALMGDDGSDYFYPMPSFFELRRYMPWQVNNGKIKVIVEGKRLMPKQEYNQTKLEDHGIEGIV